MRWALALVMLAAGCAVEQAHVSVGRPDPVPFKLVSDAIAPSCATLDCHGKQAQPFRMYWARGLRLDPALRPGEGDHTDAEYDATYRSLCGLEPFKLDAVVKGTARPETLTLVRKARGVEAHKWTSKLAIGSDPDVCLVSWLAGAVDVEACKRAATP